MPFHHAQTPMPTRSKCINKDVRMMMTNSTQTNQDLRSALFRLPPVALTQLQQALDTSRFLGRSQARSPTHIVASHERP
jgi:hypothetical protein